MSSPNEPKWYAAKVFTQHVAQARSEIQALGFLTYVPHERVERRLGRKLRALDRPVWPGYVFVHCRLSDLAAIRNIEGVADFVRAMADVSIGGEVMQAAMPVAVAPNGLVPIVLAEIFGDLDHTAKRTRSPERGDRVVVTSGKWKGFLGRILSVSKRRAIMELEKGIGKLTVDPAALDLAA